MHLDAAAMRTPGVPRPAAPAAGPSERPWPRNAPPVGPRARREVDELLATAGPLLGVDGTISPLDLESTRALLERTWRDALAVLDAATPARRSRLIDVLGRCRELDRDLEHHLTDARAASLARVRAALELLSDAESLAQVLDRGPVAAARLGFDRSLLSAVERGCFVPRSCFMGEDRERAEHLVRVGRDEPRRLDGSLRETTLVRRREAIVVDDVQTDPLVHRRMAEVSEARSYAAAPVLLEGRVAGFLHADHHARRRAVSGLDRDALWMFADAYGRALERALQATRLRELERAVEGAHRETLAALRATGVEALGLGEVRTTRPLAPVAPLLPREEPAAPAALTRRELEVVRLLAAGETNAGIAARLVISAGTAKTHVKHILRKLRAANRAEAVSRFFQLRGEH